jgi:hypothetical protein
MQLITKYIIIKEVVVPFQVHDMVFFVTLIHPWLILPIPLLQTRHVRITRACFKLFKKTSLTSTTILQLLV